MQSVRDWTRRHRRGVAVAVGAAALAYVAAQAAQAKVREWQERRGAERTARENLRRRWEQNQQDAGMTVAALLPALATSVMEELPVERITNELRRARLGSEASRESLTSEATATTNGAATTTTTGGTAAQAGEGKTKAQLWMELKVSSFARTISLVYALSLLVLLTRIQLNLLGRMAYVNSVRDAAAPRDPAIGLEDVRAGMFGKAREEYQLSKEYLSFSWWLLNMGWRALLDVVQRRVEALLGPQDLRAVLTAEDLDRLLQEIRDHLEYPGVWQLYLLPDPNDQNMVMREVATKEEGPKEVSPTLQRLLDESRDLIDSPNFDVVLGKMVGAGMDVLRQKLALSTFANGPVKLASITAGMSREAHLIANAAPNAYVAAVENVQELQAFAAIVYSNFEGGGPILNGHV